MWLPLPQQTARAEPGGLAADTASRHESHTNLEALREEKLPKQFWWTPLKEKN